MVKTIFQIFLLLQGLSLTASALPPSGSPGISSAAQDATGTVWAIPPDYWDGQISRWQDGAWVKQAVPSTKGFRLWTLTRGDDGNVYAFWQEQNQTPQCLVTVHHGTASRILARFSSLVARDWGYYCQPTLYAGAAGDVWVAGSQSQLQQISPDGSVRTFPLKPEQFFGGKLPNTFVPKFDSLVDGAGRRWFWQDPQGQMLPSILRGFLLWDGKTLTYHATLPGLPEGSYSAAAPLDATHFWLVQSIFGWSSRPMAEGGLYRVDTRTLSAVLETPPQRSAFQRTTEVFQVNGDTYVKALNPFTNGIIFWRKRAGQWRPCLRSQDANRGDALDPWLSEPSGIWSGAIGGAWWLPHDGKPAIWVNWRRGLAAQDVAGLFPLTDGRVLAFGSQGTAEMPSTPQPIRPLPPGMADDGMGAPEGLEAVMTDSRHHLWGLREHTRTLPLALAEWDGKHWQLHVLPSNSPSIRELSACDTQGRLWLTAYEWHPPAQPQPVDGYIVYDPAHDTWTDYAAVPDALQAAATIPGMAFLPNHAFYQSLPVFSGDGRVTYSDNTTIFLCDGKRWRHWQSGDILPGYGGNIPSDLHFNSEGHLALALDTNICEWTPSTGWQKTRKQKPVPYESPVPPGGPHGLDTLPVLDNLGAKWFTWQDAVYTANDSLWVKQSELSGFGSPFQQGIAALDVLRDPDGRFFFEMQPGARYDLFVWSPPPVPRPAMAIVPTADDAVAMRVKVMLTGSHWLMWRLNGGEWTAPQAMAGAASTIRLTGLAHGDYRAEVKALDRHLQPSAPAVAVFSIRVDARTQIARWVTALLSGTDDEREAAVAGLVKQPGDALPALKAARPGASEAGRWWIDAALQQLGGGN